MRSHRCRGSGLRFALLRPLHLFRRHRRAPDFAPGDAESDAIRGRCASGGSVMPIPLPLLFVCGALLVALTIYVLTGGADYGGGVWDRLASGPRAAAQRDLIERAIG